MKYKDFKQELLKNPEFRKEYYRRDLRYWLRELKFRFQIWWGELKKIKVAKKL